MSIFSSFAFLRLTTTAIYVLMTTTQRHHLFVWSVFAPKLLYEGKIILAMADFNAKGNYLFVNNIYNIINY